MYTGALQRVYAVLLLLITSLGLAKPLLVASPESKLPACCRRDGKHHCAMRGSTAQAESKPSGAIFEPKSDKCPFYPMGSLAPSSAHAALLPASALLHLPAYVPDLAASTDLRQVEAETWSANERGPPALLL